jgi:hypothetical protein
MVVSPAKSLDFDSPVRTRKASQPQLLDDAAALIEVMVTKTPDEVGSLMSISPALAELNVDRYHGWSPPFTRRNARPAVLAFAGDVYVGLDAANRFDERDLTHAQKSLRILSGLYGLLRPLDLIQPYRLEMGTRLQTERGRDLYEFWGDRITERLNADLAASPGPPVLVNLASNEYFKAVRPKRLDGRVVTPTFLDSSDGRDAKVISFFAKRARGAMAGWMIRNRVRSERALAGFDELGYAHDAGLSRPGNPVFVRHGGPG